MPEEIKASTQYGDMEGTISIDGWGGLATISLAGRGAKGYWPVGLELGAESTQCGGALDTTVYLLLVDESILEGGGPDAISKYAKQHGQLPVFRFRTDLKVEAILLLIRQLNIVLQDKITNRVPLVCAGKDVIF